MEKEVVLASVAAAKKDMLAAEEDLEKVVSALRSAPRAEKTAISAVVQAALLRLRAARPTPYWHTNARTGVYPPTGNAGGGQ